jgi:hypothetical protein
MGKGGGISPWVIRPGPWVGGLRVHRAHKTVIAESMMEGSDLISRKGMDASNPGHISHYG